MCINRGRAEARVAASQAVVKLGFVVVGVLLVIVGMGYCIGESSRIRIRSGVVMEHIDARRVCEGGIAIARQKKAPSLHGVTQSTLREATVGDSRLKVVSKLYNEPRSRNKMSVILCRSWSVYCATRAKSSASVARRGSTTFLLACLSW